MDPIKQHPFEQSKEVYLGLHFKRSELFASSGVWNSYSVDHKRLARLDFILLRVSLSKLS